MATEITAFTKENISFPDLPKEDSFMYLGSENKTLVAVADGITRDPVGVKYLPSPEDKEAIKEALKKYPRPSPAKIAADKFCEYSLASLQDQTNVNKMILREAFEYANKGIQNLNKENVRQVDYLENDFWACVASAGVIENYTFFWGYICDCGICVFDKSGKLKFRTQNDFDEAGNYIDSHGNWGDPEWRKEIRSKFRNNPKNIIDGRLISYGALTGEDTALEFLKTEKLELEKGDYIFFYSDGMEHIIYSEKFRKNLSENGLSKLENFCRIISYDDKKYGFEGTLVGVLV